MPGCAGSAGCSDRASGSHTRVAMTRMARERAKRKGNLREADECGHVDISRGFAPQKKKQGKKAKPRSDFRQEEATTQQRHPRQTDHSGATALDSHQLPGFAAAIVPASGPASVPAVPASRCARLAAYRAGPSRLRLAAHESGKNRYRLEMIYYNIRDVFLFVNAALSARYREACCRLLIAGFPQSNVSISWRTPCPRRPSRR